MWVEQADENFWIKLVRIRQFTRSLIDVVDIRY
jgi:hypothetical protein